jgi:predicted lipoprotein with Yx(FWY)xxD motif
MRSNKKIYSLLAVLCFSLCIISCSDDDDINIGLVSLQTSNTLGDILVDGSGKTLYVFTKDVNGQSQCNAGCLGNWPIYYAPDIQPGPGIDINDFTTITRSDGSQQTAYKGWPLYYYAGDDAAGETNGEAVQNVWFVAKPGYSIMLASAQLIGKDGKNYTSNYQEGAGETQYFVDAKGRTIYTFIKDYKNVNKFTAADLSNNAVWPIFHVDIDELPSTVNANDFGEIDVHGNPQLTYKGNPLYYYGEDSNRGDNKGVSVPSPGIWPVASPQTTDAPEQPTIMLRNDATLGNLLTDNQGRTLYFFARDTKGSSACSGGCLNRWPLFNVDEIIVPPGSALAASDFGSTGDGASKQITYKGRPLYYYSPTNDAVIEAAGAVGGENFGTVWYVAKPDYSLMVASAQLVGLDGKNYTSAYVEGTGNTRYFSDGAGRTLYAFTNDKKDTNKFTAADFSNDAAWPIFHVEIDRLPTGMNAIDFGEITVHGTRKQLTYKGWPLYYFGQDTAPGDNKGVSVPVPGKWPIINGDTAEAPL